MTIKYSHAQRTRAEGLGQRLIALDITGGAGNLTYKGPEATSDALAALRKFLDELGYQLKPKRIEPPLTLQWEKRNAERRAHGHSAFRAPEFRGGSPYD